MDSSPRPSTSSTNDGDRLAIKFNYMHLLDDANALCENQDVRQSIKCINSVIDRADELLPKVTHSTELYLDARIFESTVLSISQTVQNVNVGEGNFNLLLFAEHFKSKSIKDGVSSLETLASVAEPVVHDTIPAWTPLLGAFEYSSEVLNPIPRKQRARQKDEIVEKKEPQKISQVEKRGGVDERVRYILLKLNTHFRNNKYQPISYYRFVLHPVLFNKSVENIFHVSFLINDGLVKVELDDDTLMIAPVIEGKENSNPNPADASEARERKQFITSLDMKMWKDMVEELEITKAMI